MKITVNRVTQHAIDRAVERFQQPKEHAANYLRQLVANAEYQFQRVNDHGNNGYVYRHLKTGIFIVVSEDGAIVTCYKTNNEVEPVSVSISPTPAIPAELLAELKRKAGAFLRKYTRRNRELERAIIVKKREILAKQLDKLNVNNPATKAVIDVKIADIQTQLDAMKAEQTTLTAKIAEVSVHA